MDYSPINLDEKLGLITAHWSHRIIAQMNDYHFKLVKFQGEFIWHDHKDTDEVFIVLHGAMRIDFRDGSVDIREGEMFVIPQGVEHKKSAEEECQTMLVEPTGTVNTGDKTDELTTRDDIWI